MLTANDLSNECIALFPTLVLVLAFAFPPPLNSSYASFGGSFFADKVVLKDGVEFLIMEVPDRENRGFRGNF